jgi:hypothetical protein
MGTERKVFNMDMAEGSIMAIIMVSHMRRNIAKEASQVWPGMRIHIMDMVQPPGISMPSDMERQK